MDYVQLAQEYDAPKAVTTKVKKGEKPEDVPAAKQAKEEGGGIIIP